MSDDTFGVKLSFNLDPNDDKRQVFPIQSGEIEQVFTVTPNMYQNKLTGFFVARYNAKDYDDFVQNPKKHFRGGPASVKNIIFDPPIYLEPSGLNIILRILSSEKKLFSYSAISVQGQKYVGEYYPSENAQVVHPVRRGGGKRSKRIKRSRRTKQSKRTKRSH